MLLLFTDGQATDKPGGKQPQKDEAKILKSEGVKLVTVALGLEENIEKFEGDLKEMASRSDSGEPLYNKVNFDQLDSIANDLVNQACGKEGKE